MGSGDQILKSLKHVFFSFQAVGQKLAAGLTSRFDHSSTPTIIDDDDLEKLKAKVDRIRVALESAEQHQHQVSNAQTQLWMRELWDLLHRAEDVLEEIQFESVRGTRLEEFNAELVRAANGKRKREELSLFFYSYPPQNITAKIGKIMERYKEIADDRVALHLHIDDGLPRANNPQFSLTSSLILSKLYGRDEQLIQLKKMVLTQDHSRSRSYDVISLVGMPGIGKTALAQHLCDDVEIKNHFRYHFWVCASQNFDAKEIAITMLDQSGGVNGEKELRSRLKGKPVMLVIDDVWVGNKKTDSAPLKSHWETLQGLLNCAGKGSKVIFTTQNSEVGKIFGSDETFNLSGLSDDHFWELCKEKASDGRNPNENLTLEPSGREIIKKCKGLPRAAKAVGEFLRSAEAERSLENLWSHDEPLNEILSFLRVSYDRLPPHLKRCFVYCSLFPKGYKFTKEHLVRLWVAQGFVEEVGGQYFDELVNRCLFQLDSDQDAESYVMHDLLHELAEDIASEEILRIEGYQLPEIDEKVRHSSLVPPRPDQNKLESELSKERDLRTFLFLGNLHAPKPYDMNISSDIFWLIRSLRALDLSQTNITELPSSVNHLIHLRWLSLRKSKIEKLPESICGLFKLQTLILKHCYALKELPQGIKLLVGLRILPVFIIGNAPGCCGVGDLGDLVNLQESLHILGLNDVTDEAQSRRAYLIEQLKLKKLKLQWSRLKGQSSFANSDSAFMALEKLKANESLQELVIKGYPGLTFPKWVGDRCFGKLVRVNLKDCGSCEKLPSLGQLPLLKHLIVQLLEKVQSIGREILGSSGGEMKPFQALETLELRDMANLKEWSEVEEGDFPRLEEFHVVKCPVFCISALPLTLQVVYIGADCPMLGRWKSHWFQEDGNCDEGCRKLVRRDTLDLNNLMTNCITGSVESGYCHASNEEPTQHLLPSNSTKDTKQAAPLNNQQIEVSQQ